jgi:hypothetical protein
MTGFSPWLASHLDSLMLWIGVFCTLGFYSVLYRENRVYRFFEHLYLGLATGVLLVEAWNDVLLPKWFDAIFKQGEWWWIFASIVGLMYYFIFSRKLNWVARLAIGFSLGVTAGQEFQAFTNNVWPQIPKSFKPLVPHPALYAPNPLHLPPKAAEAAHIPLLYPQVTVPDAINNIVFTVVLLCVMSYFFFSFEQKSRALKGTAAMGRWLLMFAFGAIFGSTIMARLALLIDRVNFLMTDFGSGVMGPPGPLIVFFILFALCGLMLWMSLRARARGEGTDEPS